MTVPPGTGPLGPNLEARHRQTRPLAYMYIQGLYDQNLPQPEGTNRGHADSTGGTPYIGYPWAHIEQGYLGGPVSTNDTRVFRLRGGVYRVPSMCPPAEPVRWTDSGPLRPDLNMRRFTWNRWQNSSTQASRFWGFDADGNVDNAAGMHTTVPAPSTPDINRGANKPYWEKQPRQDRLSRARYRGQTYSQTTQFVESQPLGG